MSLGNCYQNWVEFICSNEMIDPCVQTEGQTESQPLEQIKCFRAQERRSCMRIERRRFPSNMDEIVGAFTKSGAADYIIILEGGWAREPSTLAEWFHSVFDRYLKNRGISVPIIVSSKAIPKHFSSLEGVKLVSNGSRALFDKVSRRWSNQFRLIYGDWGSTRPRDNPGFASRPLPRIDYPAGDHWCVARSKDMQWTYRDAAIEIINSTQYWRDDLPIWGADMITNTQQSRNSGITPQKNVAARVNIHLHLQAWRDRPDEMTQDFGDDWVD